MIWIALALSIVVAVAAFVLLRRVRVSMSTQASASENGWALAGGGSMGPVAVSAAQMHGVRGAWSVHVFGRRIVGSNGAPKKKRAEKKKDSALVRRATRVAMEIDPIVAMELALDVFARVRLESLELRVRGGDPDPLLMGRVAAVVAVASGLLAPIARIDAALDWTAEESSLDVGVSFEASFIPVVVAWDVTRSVFAQLVVRLKKAVARRPAPLPQLERA